MFRRKASKKAAAKESSPASYPQRNTLEVAQTLLSNGRGALTGELVSRILSVPASAVVEIKELEDKFTLAGRPLSEGQMSRVYQATRTADLEMRALKVFNLSTLVQSERAMLKAVGEVGALREVPHHPHLVLLHQIVCTPSNIALAVDPSPRRRPSAVTLTLAHAPITHRSLPH